MAVPLARGGGSPGRWSWVLVMLVAAGCAVAPADDEIDETHESDETVVAEPTRAGPQGARVGGSDSAGRLASSRDNATAPKPERPDGAPSGRTADGGEEAGVLDLDQVDVSDVRPWSFHGRLDVAYVYFRDSTNVDRFRRGQVLPISPAVYFEYRFFDRLALVAEVEYDGREEAIEIDQALLRIDAVEDLLTVRLGRHYFPFGLERYYYSPSRNTLVDRPAAFRQVYPGTYADNGLFAEGKYTHHTAWSLGYEAAVGQGLRGFDREDLPETLEDNNDTPFFGGRVYFRPRRELTVGASYAAGYWDRSDENWLDFFGVDARLELFELEVRAEYVGGNVNGTEEFGDFFRQGWYLHVERAFEVELEYLHAVVPVFRVDWIDSNNDLKDHLDVTRYSFGLATFFLENLQWKLEYQINDERGKDISNNGFLTQIVFHW